jgi:hypothetical protein
MQVQAMPQRQRLHGARRRAQAAACGTVWLRQHERNFMSAGEQRRQRARGEFRSAGEY